MTVSDMGSQHTHETQHTHTMQSKEGTVILTDFPDNPTRPLSRAEARDRAKVVAHEIAMRLPPEVAAELVAPFAYHAPGRPPKVGKSTTDQRNDLIRALRKHDRRFARLTHREAATSMRREMTEWFKLTWPRLKDCDEPEADPHRTYWQIATMGFTQPLEINTLKNIFSGQ